MKLLGVSKNLDNIVCDPENNIYEIEIDENAAPGHFSLFLNILLCIYLFDVKKKKNTDLSDCCRQ